MQHHAFIRRCRVATLVIGLIAAMAATVVPASAAPPANDSIASPRVVRSVPYRATQDTSEATHSPDDGSACVKGASVWFRYRPSSTARVRVVTVGSDYDTMLSVFRGPRNGRTELACSDDAVDLQSAVRVRFVAGRTYWIAVSACCHRTAKGGTAVLRLYPPRATSVTVTVTGAETGRISGRLFVEGTVACAAPSVTSVELVASQRVGANVAHAFGSGFVPECTRTPVSWRVPADSDTGWAFQPGQVALDVAAFATDGFTGATQSLETIEAVTENPNARGRR